MVKSCERNTISMQEEPVDKNVIGSLLCIYLHFKIKGGLQFY